MQLRGIPLQLLLPESGAVLIETQGRSSNLSRILYTDFNSSGGCQRRLSRRV